jgi:spermidine/putrescine transport system substrate-binding protein
MDDQERLKSLIAQIPSSRMTRRDLLRRMGIGAGAMSMAALAAACGVGGNDDDNGNGGNGNGGSDPLTTNEIQGQLDFANWDYYIDPRKPKNSTINKFVEETGIEVNYQTEVDDNQTFFAKYQQQLANGDPIGFDVIVVTDWLIGNMIALGYLELLQEDKIPNFYANAGEIYQNRSYDPGNKYSVPWQSGITGIGYNPDLTGREITSFNDLFDPAFEGQVGMMTEMRDTMNLTLLGLGINPQDATEDDARAAQQKLLEQRDAGLVRQYYGNGYIDALARGDLAITMAWSGDVFQLQYDQPEMQFVVPEEGAVLWTDNMAIPQNAAHPIDAMEMMNFYYQPEIAAQLAGYVQFICPVPAAQEVIAKTDKTTANSPLVFPTPDMESRLHSYKTLTPEEEEVWNDLFNEVVQG